MSDYVSNSYLCDSCAVFHVRCGEGRVYCHERKVIEWPIISEGQTPHEVCERYKPREDE